MPDPPRAELPVIDLEITVPRTVRTGGYVDLEPDESMSKTWPSAQTTCPAAPNYVGTRQPRDVQVAVEAGDGPRVLRFVVTRGRLSAGRLLHVIFGDRRGGSPGWCMGEVPPRLGFRLGFMTDLDTLAHESRPAPKAPVHIARSFSVDRDGEPNRYVARTIPSPPHVTLDPETLQIGEPQDPPRLQSARYVAQHGPFQKDWPMHDRYEIFSAHEGEATLTVGGRVLVACPGAVILIKPLVEHRTVIAAGKWIKGVNLSFHAGSWSTYLDRVDEGKLAASVGPSGARAASLAVDILEESRQLLPGARYCADAYLQLLVVECLRAQPPVLEDLEASEAHDGLAQARIHHCMRYVEAHYQEELTLELLAQELSVSPWHLSHTFSRRTGTTVSAHITEVRMRKAAEIVRRTTRPLKEIAAAVGYSDEFYFSKVFRRRYGMPPGAYRRSQNVP